MGVAIILSNQDFSESPLGTVTLKESSEDKAKKMAEAYCTAIGDSTHFDSVKNLMLGIVSYGLVDKLSGLYPMLGTTKQSLIVNAVTPGTNDLTILANSTAGTNEIEFSRTIGVGDHTPSETIAVDTYVSCLLYYKSKASTGAVQYNNIKDMVTQTYSRSLKLGQKLQSPNLLPLASVGGTNITPSEVVSIMNPTRIGASVKKSDGSYHFGFNANVVEGTLSSDTKDLVSGLSLNTILGGDWDAAVSTPEGETISNSQYLANGYAYLYAIGDLSGAELTTLGTLCDAFLSEVKEITIQ